MISTFLTEKKYIERLNASERNILEKVLNHQRINDEEALFLFESRNLPFLAQLANYIRRKKHGLKTYFNRNFHIEPTNVCIYDCKFCSYSRTIKKTRRGLGV
ncbi:MAG: hypothetical protein KatS3mg035_1326 [Bacteroidia bacterium]|nr:MAG: hypothetical protein KatS3mg035_1326 [Bacteroidia bacterium]